MIKKIKNMFPLPAVITKLAMASALVCISSILTYAQINATLNGYVRDPNKAVVAGATVTIESEALAVKRTTTTNEDGYFSLPNLQIGVYKLTVESPGFASSILENLKLDVGSSQTLEIDLNIQGSAATVDVTADNGQLTVNRDTANIEMLISGTQVTEHALNGRNWAQLVNLAPGTASISNDSQQGSNVRIDDTAINGLRRRTAPTIDGVSNVDHGSVGTQVNNISVDAIQEFKLVSSPYSAEHGGQAGPAVNVATKRGTTDFHGSLFEFFRHDALNAYQWEQKQRDVPEKSYLRFNNFGGFVGGPIIPKKLFFFGGMEFKRPRTGRTISELVPTDAMRNGDFSAFLPVGLPPGFTCSTTIPNSQRGQVNFGKFILCDKSASTAGTPFPNNIIPLNKQSPNGRAILNLFPRANTGLDRYIAAPITARNVRQDLLRVDYEINQKASVFGRWINDDFDSDNPLGSSFDNQNLPIAPDNHIRKGKTLMFSYTQMFGSTWINEAVLGWQRNDQEISYVDEQLIDRTARGINFQEIFPENRLNKIPEVTIAGYSLISGGGLPYVIDARSWEVRDNLTKVLGNHMLKFGGLFISSYKAENFRTRDGGEIFFNTGSALGNASTRLQDSNSAVANVLLGAFQRYTERSNTTNVPTSYNQWEFYGNDQWRAHPRLSLNFGVRFQYIPWPHTDLRNLIGFDPSRFDPSKAPLTGDISSGMINNAIPDPTGTRTRAQGYFDPYNGIVLPGDGSPLITDPNLQRLFVGRPSGIAESGGIKIAPRFGFAWDIFGDGKTSVRGGGGIYYDRTLLNPVRDAGQNTPFTQVPTLTNGRQFTTPAAVVPAYQNTLDTVGAGGAGRPFIQALNVFDLEMPPGEVYGYSLGVQRLLPFDVVLDVSYVGNQARHLTHRRDINFVLPEVALTSGTAQADTVRQFRGYGAILMQENTGVSSYDSLQVTAQKRLSKGFAGGIAYTWSKSLSNFDTETSNLRVPFDAALDKSVSNFDRPHVFVANYIYDLPFYQKQEGLVGKLLGGWQWSGIITVQSGLPVNVSGGSRATGSPSIGFNGNLDLIGDWRAVEGGQTPDNWINPAAFTGRVGLIGTLPRNLVRLPTYSTVNMSLTKRVRITENVRVQLRGEVFNLFNRANFRTLNANRSSEDFGKLTETDEPRVFQLGVKLLF